MQSWPRMCQAIAGDQAITARSHSLSKRVLRLHQMPPPEPEPEPDVMLLRIKSLAGVVTLIYVQPSDTILAAKEQLSSKLKVPIEVELLRFLYGDAELSNDVTVAEAGLQAGDTVLMGKRRRESILANQD